MHREGTHRSFTRAFWSVSVSLLVVGREVYVVNSEWYLRYVVCLV